MKVQICQGQELVSGRDRKGTYECNPMVENLDGVLDVGKLEERKQAIVSVANLIVEEHDKAGKQVDGSQCTESNESLLANYGPWSVADAKKDGLGGRSQCYDVDGFRIGTYVVILLAGLGEKSSRRRHFGRGRMCT